MQSQTENFIQANILCSSVLASVEARGGHAETGTSQRLLVGLLESECRKSAHYPGYNNRSKPQRQNVPNQWAPMGRQA